MPLPPILRLPVELHLETIVHLGIQDKSNLASSNRYFKSIISPPSHADFLAAETSAWATAKQLYACRGCHRFRRWGEFADDMRKGKRSRNQVDANARFCLECGTKGLYSLGTRMNICNQPHVFCQTCKTIATRVGDQSACIRCSPYPAYNDRRFKFEDDNGYAHDNEDDWTYSAIRSKDPHEFYDVWHDA